MIKISVFNKINDNSIVDTFKNCTVKHKVCKSPNSAINRLIISKSVNVNGDKNLSEHFRKVINVSRSVSLSLESLQLQVILRDVRCTDQKTMQRSFLCAVRLIRHLLSAANTN